MTALAAEWKKAAKWHRKRSIDVAGVLGSKIANCVRSELRPAGVRHQELEAIRWRRRYDDLAVLVCSECRKYVEKTREER